MNGSSMGRAKKLPAAMAQKLLHDWSSIAPRSRIFGHLLHIDRPHSAHAAMFDRHRLNPGLASGRTWATSARRPAPQSRTPLRPAVSGCFRSSVRACVRRPGSWRAFWRPSFAHFATAGQVQPMLGPTLTCLGQMWPEFDQHRPELWPGSAPTSANFGRSSARFCPGQTRSGLFNLATAGQRLAEICKFWSTSGQPRPKLVRVGRNVTQLGPTLANLNQSAARFVQSSGELGPTLVKHVLLRVTLGVFVERSCGQ